MRTAPMYFPCCARSARSFGERLLLPAPPSAFAFFPGRVGEGSPPERRGARRRPRGASSATSAGGSGGAAAREERQRLERGAQLLDADERSSRIVKIERAIVPPAPRTITRLTMDAILSNGSASIVAIVAPGRPPSLVLCRLFLFGLFRRRRRRELRTLLARGGLLRHVLGPRRRHLRYLRRLGVGISGRSRRSSGLSFIRSRARGGEPVDRQEARAPLHEERRALMTSGLRRIR